MNVPFLAGASAIGMAQNFSFRSNLHTPRTRLSGFFTVFAAKGSAGIGSSRVSAYASNTNFLYKANNGLNVKAEM
jgi:hypothetical protein